MKDYWFLSRAKRQLSSLLPALVSYSNVCLGHEWSQALAMKWENDLQEMDITKHGKLRARKTKTGGGGGRTMFTQMSDLGLVFREDDTNICQLTLVGQSIVGGDISFVEAMRIQLQRYQYPSATRYSGSGAISNRFSIHPFQFIFKLLVHPRLDGFITQQEMGLIVIHQATNDTEECLEKVVNEILSYRNNEITPLTIDDYERTYKDIANTIFNYIETTQYVFRAEQSLLFKKEREKDISDFIQQNPKLIPNPNVKENYQRTYGRGTSSKDLRNFASFKWSYKELNEKRIRQEYVIMSMTNAIKSITAEIIQTISNKTGIDENTVETTLMRAFPNGNLDDFFLCYRDLSKSGRESAREFEEATCSMFKNIFGMNAIHTGPIGNTPDVYIESDQYGFCGILDNKAYKKDYSITGDHRRVMEDVYIPDVHSYGTGKYPLAFFSYVSGSFCKNIDSQIQRIKKDTNICGSAMPVDILIELAQEYSSYDMTHASIRDIFSVDRLITLADIENRKQKADNVAVNEQRAVLS